MNNEAKTVNVRIAVAVDTAGKWSSAGWKGCEDKDAISSCREGVDYGEQIYFLEAELELPTAKKAASIVEIMSPESDILSAINYAVSQLRKLGDEDAAIRLAKFTGSEPRE